MCGLGNVRLRFYRVERVARKLIFCFVTVKLEGRWGQGPAWKLLQMVCPTELSVGSICIGGVPTPVLPRTIQALFRYFS